MIYSKQEFWELISSEVQALGYELFDVEMPCSKQGVMRVFISKSKHNGNSSSSQAGVSIDDCASVSRALSKLSALDDLREKYSLEVSSPGVNRKLRSLQHFLGAIGERIKITYFAEEESDSSKTDTVRALLEAVDGDELSLLIEPASELKVLKYDQVHKAQVDFMFDEVK